MKTKSILLLAAALSCGSLPSHAYLASYYAPNSVMSQGRWVKISTSEAGIYQFTYDELRALGFSNPEDVQVYGYGAVRYCENNNFDSAAPDDVIATPTYHTPDGRILFFGDGDALPKANYTTGYDTSSLSIARNYYDTRSYYFLSDVAGVKPIPYTMAVSPSTNSTPQYAHIHVDLVENDVQNPIHGGVGFHDAQVAPGSTVNYTFRLRNFRPTGRNKDASVAYFVAVSSAQDESAYMTTTANVNVTGSSCAPGYRIADGERTYFQDIKGLLRFGPKDDAPIVDEVMEFNLAMPTNRNIRYLAPDRAVLRYPRANIVDETDPCLVMHFGADENGVGQQVVFSNVPSHDRLMVWHIGDAGSNIHAIHGSFNTDSNTMSVVFTESPTRRLVAFDPTYGFPTANVVGEVANQNLHALPTPELLIITTDEFMPQAERLAAAHRTYQGMDVAVVPQREIFNEFSSGSRDIMAYRRMAKMFYDREPAKFKHILFFGPVSYDNRCVQVSQAERLVSYENTDASQTRNVITNYTSDAIFGMLANNYNHQKIRSTRLNVAVGRVPAMNLTQAGAYVDKAIERLQGTCDPAAYGRAIVVGGEGDRSTHSIHAREVESVMTEANPDLTMVMLHSQAYERNGVTESINSHRPVLTEYLKLGSGYFNYIGHGDPNFIGSNILWDRSLTSEVKYKQYPMVMFSSCDQFSFDRQENGLIETMLFAPDGGILVGVGACRSVYISLNQMECLPVAKAYARAGAGATYGDIYRDARDIIINSYEAGIAAFSATALDNCLNYNLAGDPALPAGVPDHSIEITEIDGKPAAGEAVKVKPLVPFHIKGRIAGAPNFNGTARIAVLGPRKYQKVNNFYNEENFPANDSVAVQHTSLVEIEVPVTDGLFDAAIVAPAPDRLGANRVVISACDPVNRRSALGSSSNLELLDYNPADHANVIFDAPSIEEFYVNTPEFTPGSEVGKNISVTAVIDPSSTGLAIGNEGLTSRVSLTLDGKRNLGNLSSCMSLNADGTYTLATTVEDISEGAHSLTLACVNNAGRVARSTVDFTVVTRIDRPDLAFDVAVARSAAILTSEAGVGSDNRLVITDAHGATVLSLEGVTLPYRWDLNDRAGVPVADGRYTATVLERRGADFTHSLPAEVVVLR